MGILDYLKSERGRRDSERRIQQRTKTSVVRQSTPDDDSDLEDYLQHYTNQATRFLYRAYYSTQNRKAEGKQILTGWVKHSIGVTTRTVLGPRQTAPAKPVRTVKIAKPTIKVKRRK